MVLHLHEHGKTEPKKKLRWMIANPPGALVTMNVTPELAQEMLTYNKGNRPVSESTVKRYAEQMRKGNWRLTFEPIIFSKVSRLQDGQHRCKAGLLAGCNFPARVAFGDDDENFAYINLGKKRGGADVFAINGVPNHTLMAGATRWVWSYDDNKMTGHNTALYPEPYELHAKYLEYNRIQESSHYGWLFSKVHLAPSSPMTAMHYICARKSRQKADVFFEKLATGLDFEGEKDPTYRLRNRLIKNASAEERLRAINIAALTILAWNAMRLKRTPRTFRWNIGEKFPRAI